TEGRQTIHRSADGRERVFHAVQVLGVADEEMTMRAQLQGEALVEARLRRGVEVNGHVAAEDRVERRLDGPGLFDEIDATKGDEIADALAHAQRRAEQLEAVCTHGW